MWPCARSHGGSHTAALLAHRLESPQLPTQIAQFIDNRPDDVCLTKMALLGHICISLEPDAFPNKEIRPQKAWLPRCGEPHF